jgi:hypothetical protein
MKDQWSDELRSLHAYEVDVRDSEFDIDISMSLHDLYTARACDELALALAEMIDGSEVVQVRVAGNWPGGFLLHAGVHRDDCVYDIEGVHEIDEWIERWGRGMDIEVKFSTPATDQQTFENVRSRQIAVETALRLLEVPELSNARKSLLQL